jgi:hypothetical protein
VLGVGVVRAPLAAVDAVLEGGIVRAPGPWLAK